MLQYLSFGILAAFSSYIHIYVCVCLCKCVYFTYKPGNNEYKSNKLTIDERSYTRINQKANKSTTKNQQQQAFHPLVQVPNQLVGAPVLTDVTLICNVEASPKAINYWQRENGEMIIAGDRYVLTEKEVNSYSIEMVLHIKRLQTSDFGGYKCISKNSIGDTEGTIRLYAMERPGRKNSDREEDMDDLINEVVLKENRHEDGARNQNGRLYKERVSDSAIYSGCDSLHGLAKHLNTLLYASLLLVINFISAGVQLRQKSIAEYL